MTPKPIDPGVVADRFRGTRCLSQFPQKTTCAVCRALLRPLADAEPSTAFPVTTRSSSTCLTPVTCLTGTVRE
jgi:hypothetical protein